MIHSKETVSGSVETGGFWSYCVWF